MCSRSLDRNPRYKADPERIFENFFIVSPTDYIYQFQDVPETLEKEIPKFCFPFVSERYGDPPVSVDDQYTFTFVLTQESGVMQFGYCRFISKKPGDGVPLLCMCMLSYLAQVEFIDQILDALIDFWEASLDKVRLLLDELAALPIPASGQKIVLGPKGERCTFQYPDTHTLPSIPMNPYLNTLLTALPAQCALSVFFSILYERRIVLASTRLSVLTSVAHAFNTLLYPLSWQHIFIPILPESLLDYLSAPMPFLVGVHSSLLPKIYKLQLEEVVFCDLDGKYVNNWTNDLGTLPAETVAVLEALLKRPGTAVGCNFAQVFLDFFLYLFGNYRDFIVPSAAPTRPSLSPKPGAAVRERPALEFDRAAFLASSSPELQPFLQLFVDLQMFHQFLDQRFELMTRPTATSEERIKTFEIDSLTGRVILPAWWVYDCLFEYERDVKGNKGLDPYSEKVVVLKTLMKGTLREGQKRLKPKISAYSSKVKGAISGMVEASSANGSPQPTQRSGSLLSSVFGASTGNAQPQTPPKRPKPPANYVPSRLTPQGSWATDEEPFDPFVDHLKKLPGDAMLLTIESPKHKTQVTETKAKEANLLELDSPDVHPRSAPKRRTGSAELNSSRAGVVEPFDGAQDWMGLLDATPPVAAPATAADQAAELKNLPSLTDWSDFESALPMGVDTLQPAPVAPGAAVDGSLSAEAVVTDAPAPAPAPAPATVQPRRPPLPPRTSAPDTSAPAATAPAPARQPAPAQPTTAANGSLPQRRVSGTSLGGAGTKPAGTGLSAGTSAGASTTDSFDKLDVFGTGPRPPPTRQSIGAAANTGTGMGRPAVPPKPATYTPYSQLAHPPGGGTQRQDSHSRTVSGGGGPAHNTRVQWNMNAPQGQYSATGAAGGRSTPSYHTLNVHYSGTSDAGDKSSSAMPTALAPPPPPQGSRSRSSSGQGGAGGYALQRPPSTTGYGAVSAGGKASPTTPQGQAKGLGSKVSKEELADFDPFS